MSIEQLIKRAERAIKKRQLQDDAPSVFESIDGLFPEYFAGLIIIYDKHNLKDHL